MEKLHKNYSFLLSLAFFAVILFLIELFCDSYIKRLVSITEVYAVMAVSLTLINGVTGIFSLGHSGFIAIGAYVSALLTMPLEQKQFNFIMDDIIVPFNMEAFSGYGFIWATIIAALVSGLFAFIIGWASLRLSGDYLGITTLGFSEIIRIAALNWPGLTNGALGLKGIPSYTNIWWGFAWLVVTVLFIINLLNSSFGRALKAVKQDPVAAKSMGIDVFKHQLVSFVIGGFFAGVSGSLYAHWLTTIDPRTSTIGVPLTFNILIMIVLGGLGSISGAVIGAVIFSFLSEFLRFIESDIVLGSLRIPGISGMRTLVFSVIFILVMVLWPSGIMGNKELKLRLPMLKKKVNSNV